LLSQTQLNLLFTTRTVPFPQFSINPSFVFSFYLLQKLNGAMHRFFSPLSGEFFLQ